MVTVGVLASLINVAVLLVVSVADRLTERVVRRFAAARLHRHRSAPVVHDSDTWLPNIPRSIIKYRQHPAILITIIFASLLIASELVTELGVEQSENCSLKQHYGRTITVKEAGISTVVEQGASCLLLQTIKFIDGPVTRVTAGMPVRLNPRVCLSCFSGRPDTEVIASGCTVTALSKYGTGELDVHVKTTSGAFLTISAGFTERGRQRRNFSGFGDLTNNGVKKEIFTFYKENADPPSAIYLAYNMQRHIGQLANRSSKAAKSSRNREPPIVSEPSQGPVWVYRVSCKNNRVDPDMFLSTLQVYRTMQLENTIALAEFRDETNMTGRFQQMSGEDVLRAILAVKVIDDKPGTGTFFEYTKCGTYKFRFIAPFAISLVGIAVLLLISIYSAPREVVHGVPYNSNTWFKQAAEQSSRARGGADSMRAAMRRATTRAYWSGQEDRLVLRDDGDDTWIEVQSGDSHNRNRHNSGNNNNNVSGENNHNNNRSNNSRVGVSGSDAHGFGGPHISTDSRNSEQIPPDAGSSGILATLFNGAGRSNGGAPRPSSNNGPVISGPMVFNPLSIPTTSAAPMAASMSQAMPISNRDVRGNWNTMGLRANGAAQAVGPQWSGMNMLAGVRFRSESPGQVTIGIDSVTQPDCVYRDEGADTNNAVAKGAGSAAGLLAEQQLRDNSEEHGCGNSDTDTSKGRWRRQFSEYDTV